MSAAEMGVFDALSEADSCATAALLVTVGRVEAQGSCSTYPLVWSAPANAQSDAESDVHSIANPFLARPLMIWSTPRGTFTSLSSVDYVFPNCASGTNVSASFFTLAASVPHLLPMTSSEWAPANDIQCQNVSTSSWHTVVLHRQSLAGENEFHDFFSFNVLKTEAGVMVRSMSAEYVPIAPATIDQNMAACGNLTQNTAETTVFGSSFVYTILGPYCSYVSDDRYYPNLGAVDTVTFVGNPFWEWADGTTSVSLRKMQRVNLEVNPLNVTQNLIESDAYCGPNAPVGWELVLDAVTGALLQTKAGIGCVCFN
jgi:hypothetical protein